MFAVYRQLHGGQEVMDVFFEHWSAVRWLKRSKNYESTKNEIKNWFEEGLRQKATHMIVVCDTFEWEDFPVYVAKSQDVVTALNKYINDAHHRVMEVYNLGLEIGVPLQYGRAFSL